jgi:hypothetical protein
VSPACPAPDRNLCLAAKLRHAGVGLGLLAAWLTTGCGSQTEFKLREEVAALNLQIEQKNSQLELQKAVIDKLKQQLDVARNISEDDLKRIFYADRLVIEKISGGENYDGKPGDDGVTVYLQPIDPDGDVIKVAGDITIQLYDLAAPPQQNFIGEYKIPVDQAGKLWHGKLWTNHYAIKCPWPGAPPQHPEITIRAVFVDYLTKRVVAAQSTCTVKLPP